MIMMDSIVRTAGIVTHELGHISGASHVKCCGQACFKSEIEKSGMMCCGCDHKIEGTVQFSSYYTEQQMCSQNGFGNGMGTSTGTGTIAGAGASTWTGTSVGVSTGTGTMTGADSGGCKLSYCEPGPFHKWAVEDGHCAQMCSISGGRGSTQVSATNTQNQSSSNGFKPSKVHYGDWAPIEDMDARCPSHPEWCTTHKGWAVGDDTHAGHCAKTCGTNPATYYQSTTPPPTYYRPTTTQPQFLQRPATHNYQRQPYNQYQNQMHSSWNPRTRAPQPVNHGWVGNIQRGIQNIFRNPFSFR